MKKNLFLVSAALLLGGATLFAQDSPKSTLERSTRDTTKKANVNGVRVDSRLQENSNPNEIRQTPAMRSGSRINNEATPAVGTDKTAPKQNLLEKQP